MARTAIWKSIADSLETDIASGRYAIGAKLPSEAQLAGTFGVNRHTVRRALAELTDQGLVHPRPGAGVFVATQAKATPKADYPLGKRVSFRQNLRAAGRAPSGEQLAVTTRRADKKEATALKIDVGALLHVNDSLSFADAEPVSLARSCFPADRFPTLPEVIRETGSVTETFRQFGITDYTRAWTRITATAATATQALHLRVNEGDPLLRTVSLNVDADGRPVEYGSSYFAGNRIALTLEDEDS
ncbi:phosphonate metabolism transcriptional regulator PhnF [Tritonibacter multivorans]|uniref:phosphonate metabolism transcriptional regulator PhnF n=1 Tax=Tritonibacter multivorans TaxID=928856 RepID=UPI002301BA90|nr:phosphonate metabolism transcriptional regulator PhnF [Tritonibacter multivorans]MDA7419634.1 phosphonate metabolism transcriptional regulator PhnF [Tritonibacter multivorans]